MTGHSSLYAKPLYVDDPAICHFYHSIDLPGVGLQIGEWDLRGNFEKYTGNISLANKRILDVGCGGGFLSFSAEQAGAQEVVSMDMDDSTRQNWLPFHEKAAYKEPELFRQQHNKWIQKWRNAYWMAHRLKGSNAKVFYGNVYDLPMSLGLFDVVFVCSILEHLADPIKALTSVSRLASSEIVVTTPMLDSDDRIARFAGDALKPGIDYVWWIYSRGIYWHVFKMLGFDIVSITQNKFKFVLGNSMEARTTIVARRSPG